VNLPDGTPVHDMTIKVKAGTSYSASDIFEKKEIVKNGIIKLDLPKISFDVQKVVIMVRNFNFLRHIINLTISNFHINNHQSNFFTPTLKSYCYCLF